MGVRHNDGNKKEKINIIMSHHMLPLLLDPVAAAPFHVLSAVVPLVRGFIQHTGA